MKDEFTPYFCGGILLVLLTEAKNKTATRRQLINGEKERASNRNILERLIQLMMPSYHQPSAGRTFEGDTSDYRACKVSHGANLPFDNQVEISAFDERVKTQYTAVLRKMDDFIDELLDTESRERMHWLAHAVLTLIEKDDSILPDALFYLSDTPVTKSIMLSDDRYCLSSLLVGVWHFIVTSRPDNVAGRATFERLHIRSNEKNAKWVFDKQLFKTYQKEIKLTLLGASDNQPDDAGKSWDGSEETEPDVPEAYASREEQEFKKETQVLIKEGRIYQQQADKIYNIEHIENFYG